LGESIQHANQKASPVIGAGELVHSEWRKSLELCFGKRLQALGTDAHALGHTISSDVHFLDVGLPLTLRRLLGPGHVMPKLNTFITDFALSHVLTPFSRTLRSLDI
jgi:hypothetical protein